MKYIHCIPPGELYRRIIDTSVKHKPLPRVSEYVNCGEHLVLRKWRNDVASFSCPDDIPVGTLSSGRLQAILVFFVTNLMVP